jgi:hypothetical protein
MGNEDIKPKDVGSVEDDSIEPTIEPAPQINTEDFVSSEDFNKLKGSIDDLQLKLGSFGQPQQAPVAPPVDTTGKELADINIKIESMNEKIDKAVYEGKGVGSLLCERDRLIDRRMELKNDAKFNEFKTAGVNTLDRLSDQVVRTQMPHLGVPEIQRSYDQALSQMDPSVRMNPEVRLAAYHHAIGSHMDVIIDGAVQKALRADDTPTNDTATTTGRTADSKNKGGVPSPEDILSKDNLRAIQSVGKDVDSYYKSLGYEGWEDHYNQNKEFYEGESK